MPVLELDDGCCLQQSIPIANYVAACNGFCTPDAMAEYKCTRLMEDVYTDRLFPAFKKVIESKYDPECMKNFCECYCKAVECMDKCLDANCKFLCGNKLVVYDFIIAGFWMNVVCNPCCKCKDEMCKLYDEKTPPKVKKYIECFKEEMKDYLAKRPECSM